MHFFFGFWGLFAFGIMWTKYENLFHSQRDKLKIQIKRKKYYKAKLFVFPQKCKTHTVSLSFWSFFQLVKNVSRNEEQKMKIETTNNKIVCPWNGNSNDTLLVLKRINLQRYRFRLKQSGQKKARTIVTVKWHIEVQL